MNGALELVALSGATPVLVDAAEHDDITARTLQLPHLITALLACRPLNTHRSARRPTITPPEPLPKGRSRSVGDQDHEQLVRWVGEFVDPVGETPAVDIDSWAGSRFAGRRFTFWQTPDGAPVSMAATTSMVAGMVGVDPVYTPAHLRGAAMRAP